MSLVELIVERIQYSETQTGAYVLFLSEPVSQKKIPIVIGGLEAHAITLGLEKDIKPQRPLTHDLMKSLMDVYQIKLKKVIINKLEQGIFYALLITEKDGKEQAIDSRTSDAIALAVRFDVPIFCKQSILQEAGIFFPDQSKTKEKDEEEQVLEQLLKEVEDLTKESSEPKPQNKLTKEIEQLAFKLFGNTKKRFSKSELEKMLQEAIEEELYEKAAQLKRLIELLDQYR